MRNKFAIILSILLLGAINCPAEPLANENLRGTSVRSIESALRLAPDEIDLATAVLIISEEWNENVYGREYISILDDMAYELADRIKKKGIKQKYKVIPIINEYLYDELGFKAVKEAKDPEDLFLHSVIDRKQGYCLSLSMLYLSLGERLGLDLYGVVVPGHFFVRYDDGNVRFNIETTGKGGYADDNHYIEKFDVPKDNGIYMENLNKKQSLGCFFNNLGNCYKEVGNIKSALMSLENAVEINPLLAESHSNLGNIYIDTGRIDEAVYEYQAALEINPKDSKTHCNLGNVYAQQEKLSDAIREYNESLRVDPNFLEAYKNIANAYCRKKSFSRALYYLNQATELAPNDANIVKQYGDIYSNQKDHEKALEQYQKAVKMNPNIAECYFEMAVCYNGMGLVDKEIENYKKALEIKPDLFAAIANLGNVYFTQEKYDLAIYYYNKAVEINPNIPTFYYNLGAAYSNKDNYEKAETSYQKAIELDPDMAEAHSGLAFVFYRLEQYDLAWEHLNIAEGLGERVPRDLYNAIKNRL